MGEGERQRGSDRQRHRRDKIILYYREREGERQTQRERHTQRVRHKDR